MIIFLLILLILLNGIFSMSEIALVSSRKFKLEALAKRGSTGAKKALALAAAPNRFLSTVQIGITLVSLLVGIYSGNALRVPVEQFLTATWPALQPYASDIAFVSVLLLTTYLSIVLGELFPKRIGLTFPEAIASMVATPMDLLSRITGPFVWLLTRSNDLLLSLFGIKARTDGIVTEAEIKSMISESTESGEIQEIEQDIVERVFALGDRKVSSLMTHRSDIVWLDLHDSPADIRRKIGGQIYNVYPVADGDLDDILGVVSVKDLFLQMDVPDFHLRNSLQEPVYTPGSSSAYKLLDDFRHRRFHYGIVVDEFGTIQGIITMDDILDALVGDVSEHDQDEYKIVQQDEKTWLADGQYPFFEFLRAFEIEDDEFSDTDFSTLAGFVIARINAMPKQGDQFDWHDLHFAVTQMDGRRIHKIVVLRN